MSGMRRGSINLCSGVAWWGCSAPRSPPAAPPQTSSYLQRDHLFDAGRMCCMYRNFRGVFSVYLIARRVHVLTLIPMKRLSSISGTFSCESTCELRSVSPRRHPNTSTLIESPSSDVTPRSQLAVGNRGFCPRTQRPTSHLFQSRSNILERCLDAVQEFVVAKPV